MPAFSIKLGTAITWGAPTALGASKGIVLSCEAKSTAKMHEQLDADGGLASAIYHDQREEVTVEILADPAAVQPDIGDSINIGGVTAVLVTEATTKWSTTEGKKFSISGFKSVI